MNWDARLTRRGLMRAGLAGAGFVAASRFFPGTAGAQEQDFTHRVQYQMYADGSPIFVEEFVVDAYDPNDAVDRIMEEGPGSDEFYLANFPLLADSGRGNFSAELLAVAVPGGATYRVPPRQKAARKPVPTPTPRRPPPSTMRFPKGKLLSAARASIMGNLIRYAQSLGLRELDPRTRDIWKRAGYITFIQLHEPRSGEPEPETCLGPNACFPVTTGMEIAVHTVDGNIGLYTLTDVTQTGIAGRRQKTAYNCRGLHTYVTPRIGFVSLGDIPYDHRFSYSKEGERVGSIFFNGLRGQSACGKGPLPRGRFDPRTEEGFGQYDG